jgi:hypothetical protein
MIQNIIELSGGFYEKISKSGESLTRLRKNEDSKKSEMKEKLQLIPQKQANINSYMPTNWMIYKEGTTF